MAHGDGFLGSLMDSSRPAISFEFFPPKDEAGFETFLESFGHLKKLNPDFASVTYGAMGSNQETSLAVVEAIAAQTPTIAHLTCIGATEPKISNLLGRYESAGVAGLLALRGDIPKHFDGDPLGDFQNATQLVELAHRISKLQIGVSAFPEKHPESPDMAHDISILKLKQDSGASFAITQMFFEVDAYFSLVSSAKAAGVTMPIVPGVMPIANAKQVLRMAEMSGAAVPDDLLTAFANTENAQEIREIGMAFSIDFAKRLISGGAPGVHVFTLNQHLAATELVEGIGIA